MAAFWYEDTPIQFDVFNDANAVFSSEHRAEFMSIYSHKSIYDWSEHAGKTHVVPAAF